MLRDEGPIVLMAGCTDLLVSLNFGTLQGTRFLNLSRARHAADDPARGSVTSIGALATYTDLIRRLS